MRSGEILRLIGIHRQLELSVRPSEIMGITDSYTAFCFDEAAAFIVSKLRDGEKPVMEMGRGDEPARYRRPSDLYNKYGH